MKEKLIAFLKKDNELKKLDLDKLLAKPKIESHGDFSLPMFVLAGSLKKNPQEVAKEFEGSLSKKLPDFLNKIVATGPFLNFYLNNEMINKQILSETGKGSFKFKIGKPEKIVMEYPSPNTNKSLHLGHVRNILIGNALTNIFESVGHKVFRTNMNNDRGIAICKSMLGYELFYAKDTPETLNMKPDEFVSMCYVKFGQEAKKNEKLNEMAQETLVKWESKDCDTIYLWETIMKWVFQGYKQTYKNYKIKKYDKEYFESDIYNKGREIVLDALKRKVKGFKKEEDGAVCVDFEDETYGKKYLLRKDGTTLYMTQDIHLAYEKESQFKADKYIFVVSNEQKYHFEVLFEILRRIGFGGTDKNYHFAYGYVYDENGNIFSSRKGKVIGADWLLGEVIQKAKENLLTKELTKNLSEEELDKRANIIGYSALAFSFLKKNPIDDIKFDMEKALAFEGETGPYVQYTYARIKSILRKADYKKTDFNIDYSIYSGNEISLIKKLGEFEEVILESADKYKPSHIANYLIAVCKLFNEFYQNNPILKEKKDVMNARLLLCVATSNVLKEGLRMLDIEVLEEM